jgi:hypothetical protein
MVMVDFETVRSNEPGDSFNERSAQQQRVDRIKFDILGVGYENKMG